MKWHHTVRPLVLGSTQPLREISTRNVSWRVKGGRWAGLLPPSRADWLEITTASIPGVLKACLDL